MNAGLAAGGTLGSRVYLTVVIPAFDEVDRIGATVQRVLAYLDRQPFTSELVVVLDGGRPGADRAIARAAGGRPNVHVLDNGCNRGKGFSIRRGVSASRGAVVVCLDADLSLPIEESHRLVSAIEAGADVAIGSRALPDSVERGEPQRLRHLLSRLFNQIVRRVAVSGFADTQCGFKAFAGERARRLFRVQRLDGFGFDVEVLRIAIRRGYRVVEVPVTCEYRATSSVRKLRDGVSMLVDLARLRWHDARGHYDDVS